MGVEWKIFPVFCILKIFFIFYRTKLNIIY